MICGRLRNFHDRLNRLYAFELCGERPPPLLVDFECFRRADLP